jgi:hypothetical protein
MPTEGTPKTPVRGAKNEDRCRSYNEQISPHNAVHVWSPPYADWVCECADEECLEPARLTIAEYEAVRTHPTHFLVAPGDDHVDPELERVVARHERYWVVEKQGEAATVAANLDPRGEAEVVAHADDVAWNPPPPKH